MSSWLDNIAAHGGLVEEEEDDEEQPQVVQVSQKIGNDDKSQIPDIKSKDSEEVAKIPATQEAAKDVEPVSEAKSEDQIIDIENPQEKAKEPGNGFSGQVSKEMKNLNKALRFVLKAQEVAYVTAMLKTRQSLDNALEKTSRPIQTIGGLGKISLEAKNKYDNVKTKILAVQPICKVTKTEVEESQPQQ